MSLIYLKFNKRNVSFGVHAILTHEWMWARIHSARHWHFFFFHFPRASFKWMSVICALLHLLMRPTSAQRTLEQIACDLCSVAWSWGSLRSCCFSSLLLTWRVTSSVGTHMWHREMHTGMYACYDRRQTAAMNKGWQKERSQTFIVCLQKPTTRDLKCTLWAETMLQTS